MQYIFNRESANGIFAHKSIRPMAQSLKYNLSYLIHPMTPINLALKRIIKSSRQNNDTNVTSTRIFVLLANSVGNKNSSCGLTLKFHVAQQIVRFLALRVIKGRKKLRTTGKRINNHKFFRHHITIVIYLILNPLMALVEFVFYSFANNGFIIHYHNLDCIAICHRMNCFLLLILE